ncbi:MAG: WXG100 family type VII secretion target [Coriobacteriia bacterium]|nr:WXG100 family type VII secretion target [Coriobacteriia bacterium]
MPQIKADNNAFLATKSKQQATINVLMNLSNTQTQFLNQLGDAWKGDSGTIFHAAIAEISREMESGIFMIQTLNNQTTAAHSLFLQADAFLANALGNPQKGK